MDSDIFLAFTNLDITDDFLFYSTLSKNMELCRELLEIILNQKISQELKDFLEYLVTRKCDSAFTKRLDEEVKSIMKIEEWMLEYMKICRCSYFGILHIFVGRMDTVGNVFGIFELDDLFHNTLGCALGYGVFVIGMWILGRKGISNVDKVIVTVLWLGVIGFFTFAYAMGQPLFDRFVMLIRYFGNGVVSY